MPVFQASDGTYVSRRFRPADRIVGGALLGAAAGAGSALYYGCDTGYWLLPACLFIAAFLALPGLYFLLFRNEIVVDPETGTVAVIRSWGVRVPSASFDFAGIRSVVFALQGEHKGAKHIRWQVILRTEDGGVVFTTPTPEKAEAFEIAERLSTIMKKEIEYVKEKEDGSGYVTTK